MTPEQELNHTILIKYLKKHYRIIKINPVFPISKKLSSRIEYAVLDIADNDEENILLFKSYLCKIFSVDLYAVNTALNELVQEEIIRLRAQTILDF
jgi:hypothetical protein